MIRLLWLFLILDVALTAFILVCGLATGSAYDHSDIWLRITIELAALAIIEAVRERNV